jgi:predicted small integral membrane protein
VVLALKTVEWTQVVATAFAAIAALASGAAVWQSRRALQDTLLPRLVGVWKDPAASGGRVRLEIANTGSGFAHAASFYVVSGSQYARGRITETGLMLPQEVVHIDAQLPAIGTQTIIGVLFCEDLHGRWHVWSWAGKHRRPRTRLGWHVKSLDWERALHTHFPNENDVGRAKIGFAREKR